MITEALLHCRGIGPARLAQLNKLGIRTWMDVVGQADRVPLGCRDALVDECRRCLVALSNKNVRYFVDSFTSQDRWRVLAEFFEQTSFFDIETTGLECDSRITVIACWHRGQLHTFVEHENLDDFLNLLDEVTLLASFNGSSFDVPRVLDFFHIPELPCPHLDLRWSCYHRGLRGSLKDIAGDTAMSRPADLRDADGLLALQLWNRWTMQQDRVARNRLLRYCASDVLMLVVVASQVAGCVPPTNADLWSHLPAVSPPPAPEELRPVQLSKHAAFGNASPSRIRARRVRRWLISPAQFQHPNQSRPVGRQTDGLLSMHHNPILRVMPALGAGLPTPPWV